MTARDDSCRQRNPAIPALAAVVFGLAACAPANVDVVTATICVSPESTATQAQTAMHNRIERGDYGKVSVARFGPRYVDMSGDDLRVRAHCCGHERTFKECAAGTTPVDLIVDVRREMSTGDKEQLSRQLALELEAALETVQP